MAYKCPKVLLGFEDEFITDKNKAAVSFTTNKIGGKPDWPLGKRIETPACPLCQLPRPLVLQIYAPVEHSTYHRTLYLFACINANCWNHSDSWTCIRVQSLDRTESLEQLAKKKATDWCQDADDWDDNNSNIEENGNVVNFERISDEDDESCSFDESIRIGLGNLNVDDRNANKGLIAEAQGGAVGRLHSPGATAEIEGDEGEEITVDTPTLPQYDLNALLQEITPLPQSSTDITKFSNLQFQSYFMSVWEDVPTTVGTSDRHVRELLSEYQQKTDEITDDKSSNNFEEGGGGDENYEKGIPAHGDKMFHYFCTKVQTNPGQIIRYSRETAPPLLLYPLVEMTRRCEYCKEEMIYEFQVMPTIITKLQLTCDIKVGDRLEFGTVLVFTCRQSCWSIDTNMRKEHVVVQTEK